MRLRPDGEYERDLFGMRDAMQRAGQKRVVTQSRSRFRHIAKWAGAVVSIAIIVAWLLSVPLLLDKPIRFELQRGPDKLALEQGHLFLLYAFGRAVAGEPVRVEVESCAPTAQSLGFRFGLILPMVVKMAPGIWWTALPLWLIFAIVAVPTWYCWRRSRHRYRRRVAHGCCFQCGYNLTGNVSGICSECGAPITRREALKQ